MFFPLPQVKHVQDVLVLKSEVFIKNTDTIFGFACQISFKMEMYYLILSNKNL